VPPPPKDWAAVDSQGGGSNAAAALTPDHPAALAVTLLLSMLSALLEAPWFQDLLPLPPASVAAAATAAAESLASSCPKCTRTLSAYLPVSAPTPGPSRPPHDGSPIACGREPSATLHLPLPPQSNPCAAHGPFANSAAGPTSDKHVLIVATPPPLARTSAAPESPRTPTLGPSRALGPSLSGKQAPLLQPPGPGSQQDAASPATTAALAAARAPANESTAPCRLQAEGSSPAGSEGRWRARRGCAAAVASAWGISCGTTRARW
jgi:hypothetical protein